MQSLRGRFPFTESPVHVPRHSRTVVEAGSEGCTLVDPLDSFVPCESDHEFDNLMDSDEELEFEENLRRSNSSTVPPVPLQNSPHWLSRRKTAIDEGSENLHVSSEDEFSCASDSGRQVVPRIGRTSVADLPGDFTTAAGVMGLVNRFFCIASDREDESGSDTESVQQVRRPRRLRLRWRSSVEQPDVVVPEVPNVVNVMDNHAFSARFNQQQIEVASPVVEPIAFHRGEINPGAAIQTGWWR